MKRSQTSTNSSLVKETSCSREVRGLKTTTSLASPSVPVIKNRIKQGVTMSLGAFGEVRKCLHKKVKQVRAVKILRKDALNQ